MIGQEGERPLSRQYQTIFGDADGNCFSTCVACMFGIPTHEVPNFCADNSPDYWWDAFREWLLPRGFTPIVLRTNGKDGWVEEFKDVTMIAGGPGPRGGEHAVLWRNGALLHDPHPSGDGLVSIDDVTMLISNNVELDAGVQRK
jgi:hypothetical protein